MLRSQKITVNLINQLKFSWINLLDWEGRLIYMRQTKATEEEKEIYILGINYVGADASASLLKNARIIASAMEERFTRIKKDRSFPTNAINFCLKYANLTIEDIDLVTYYMIPEDLFNNLVIHHLGKYYPKSIPLFTSTLNRALKVNNVEKEIRERLNYHGKIYFCDHHLAHIASSFFLSEFDDAAAISMDGLGEIASTFIADVENNEIKVLKRVDFPHSLGMLYNAVTHYLGFDAVQDPGKVMGLSSYGDPKKYIDEFRKIVILKEDGTYELDLSYFEFPFRRDVWISDKFITVFGPRREPDSHLEKRYEDVAAALQVRLEDVYFHMVEYAKKATNKDYLCLSGGVALNSVANGRILKKEIFKDIYIPPACGDDGLSIGAPLYYNFCVLKNKKRYPLETPYLGPEYSDEEIVKIIKKFNLKYYKSDNVCKETAKLIADNKIIGWFQGRMEIGPRALGNRSILANPALNNVKELLNSRVKFRESFRPFAPSVLVEDVKDWFEYDHPVPYMLFVFKINEDKQKLVPGITHIDGTGRLQTVSKTTNEKYHKLISEFKRLTGIPMVVNTSFNIKGEPIIESPVNAIKCFLGNGLDYLVMSDFVIKK